MISLYRDPQCKSVVIKIQPKDVPGTTADEAFNELANGQTVKTLQKKIKELESRIQAQHRQLKIYADRDGPFRISPEPEITWAKTDAGD